MFFSVSFSKCGSNNDKIFKQDEPIEILKIVDLIENVNT